MSANITATDFDDPMKLKLALAVFVVLTAISCTPKYGQQTCKSNADCPSDEYCEEGCSTGDAGPGVTVSGHCAKSCTADSDCGSLGLKKPLCAGYVCTSRKSCAENPF